MLAIKVLGKKESGQKKRRKKLNRRNKSRPKIIVKKCLRTQTPNQFIESF